MDEGTLMWIIIGIIALLVSIIIGFIIKMIFFPSVKYRTVPIPRSSEGRLFRISKGRDNLWRSNIDGEIIEGNTVEEVVKKIKTFFNIR